MQLKRIIPAVIAAAAIAVPAAASAAPNSAAQCGTGAASGAFGAFGNNGSLSVYHIHDQGLNKGGTGDGNPVNGTIGANGPATGANNSAVCGQGHS